VLLAVPRARLEQYETALCRGKLLTNGSVLGVEVFTAVAMKNALFWDMAKCEFIINRHFGGTHHLHLQGKRNK
jgi:hypothetical protein